MEYDAKPCFVFDQIIEYKTKSLNFAGTFWQSNKYTLDEEDVAILFSCLSTTKLKNSLKKIKIGNINYPIKTIQNLFNEFGFEASIYY